MSTGLRGLLGGVVAEMKNRQVSSDSREYRQASRGNAELQFWVPGIPQPGGSKKPFYNKHTGRAMIVDDAKRNKEWRASVAQAASMATQEMFDGPLRVKFQFFFTRPKGHYGTGGNATALRKKAPPFPAVRPDVTKLIRSTEDALKGILWRDDNQIVTQAGTKRYAAQAGAWITVRAEDLTPCPAPPTPRTSPEILTR